MALSVWHYLLGVICLAPSVWRYLLGVIYLAPFVWHRLVQQRILKKRLLFVVVNITGTDKIFHYLYSREILFSVQTCDVTRVAWKVMDDFGVKWCCSDQPQTKTTGRRVSTTGDEEPGEMETTK